MMVVFFLEVGLLLVVLPWTSYWERNYFAAVWPWIHPMVVNDFIRGGVTGLGVLNLLAGLSELIPFFEPRE
jgi:hypothetical protein